MLLKTAGEPKIGWERRQRARVRGGPMSHEKSTINVADKCYSFLPIPQGLIYSLGQVTLPEQFSIQKGNTQDIHNSRQIFLWAWCGAIWKAYIFLWKKLLLFRSYSYTYVSAQDYMVVKKHTWRTQSRLSHRHCIHVLDEMVCSKYFFNRNIRRESE